MFKHIDADSSYLTVIAAVHEKIPQHYKEWQVSDLDIALRHESLKLLLTHMNDKILVIEADQQLLAFVWYSMTDFTHIKSLWVHPERRGFGYAIKLKNEIKRISMEQGMKYIMGTVHPCNVNMIAINRKLGYNWEGKNMILEL